MQLCCRVIETAGSWRMRGAAAARRARPAAAQRLGAGHPGLVPAAAAGESAGGQQHYVRRVNEQHRGRESAPWSVATAGSARVRFMQRVATFLEVNAWHRFSASLRGGSEPSTAGCVRRACTTLRVLARRPLPAPLRSLTGPLPSLLRRIVSPPPQEHFVESLLLDEDFHFTEEDTPCPTDCVIQARGRRARAAGRLGRRVSQMRLLALCGDGRMV